VSDGTDGLSFPTSLGTSSAEAIRLLGQDLTADLMGKVGFGELAFWLVAMRRPTPSETRVFEAVLVALADHGFTPTALAARLTYLSAPDSLQGALAAGLLGGGSRFLGVTEDCGLYLHGVLQRHEAAGGALPAGPGRGPADQGREAFRARPRASGAQGDRSQNPGADRDRR
jgi:citrate synthase